MFLYKQITLPNKEIRNSLQNIYGLGWFKSTLILAKLGLSYPFFISYLNLYHFNLLIIILNSYSWLEVRIRRIITFKYFEMLDINSYKALRHGSRLPCRGQRTRTNAKTRKKILKAF